MVASPCRELTERDKMGWDDKKKNMLFLDLQLSNWLITQVLRIRMHVNYVAIKIF